jgi:hypothetical protein
MYGKMHKKNSTLFTTKKYLPEKGVGFFYTCQKSRQFLEKRTAAWAAVLRKCRWGQPSLIRLLQSCLFPPNHVARQK